MRKLFIIIFLLACLIKNKAQVNLQTGSATFSLPIFNWQDDKSRLNAIVSLNYNSGNGLRVNDAASNVGQGWNLTAGGVITRMQIGEPDDQKPKDGAVEDITKYPAGYLYNPDDVDQKGCPMALTKYPIFGDKNHVYKQNNAVAIDKELDYFSFQFNGRSGMFVLSKNTNDNCLLLGDSKLKAWFTKDESMPNIRTTITAFFIQDENGLVYKFTMHGLTKVLSTGYCDANQVELLTQPTFNNGGVYHEKSIDKGDFDAANPWIIGSWYLTEIKDTLTNRIISFNYVQRNINNIAGTDISYHQGDKSYSLISHKYSQTQTPELSSIIFPDGHNVVFNYGNARVDLMGDYALSSIDITYQGRYLSKYQLKTSYFILNRYGTPITDYEKSVARLCLLSVKKVGVDLKGDENPYIFDYYTGSNASDDFVPPPFFHLKDIWGFYNGSNSEDYNGTSLSPTTPLSSLNNAQLMGLCFLRTASPGYDFFNAKDGYAKNGLLRQIIYPTGGTLTYEYVQNTGVMEGQAQKRTVGGVHVSKTSATDGGYSNGCDNPIVTQYNYVLDALGNPSSIWGLEMPDNSMSSFTHYNAEYPYYRWSFPVGHCGYKYQYPGILSNEDAVSLTGRQQFWSAFATISNIISVLTEIKDILTLAFSGTGVGAVIIDIIGDIINLLLSCGQGNHSKDYTSTAYYNFDLNSANPLPVQFKRVEIVQGSGAVGKTVQEFTSNDDYGLWVPAGANPDFTMQQRFAYWAYGLPKITTEYDSGDNIVKQVINDYDFSTAKHVFSVKGMLWAASCKCLVKKSYSQRNIDWSNSYFYNANYITNSTPDLNVDTFQAYTGRVNLTDVHERTNKPNSSQYLETITHYDYDNNYYYPTNPLNISRITTTQSNGDIKLQYIKYSSDYNSGILATLNNNNILSIPVESANSIIKNGTSHELYLNEKVTEFTQLANGDIKPLRTLEQRFSQPQSSIHFYGGPGDNYSGYKETQTFTYDANDNLITMKDEGNHVVSNIYDYNDKYIVASIINANRNIDIPAYTSFETSNYFGGWTLNGTPAYVTTTSITGVNSFALSAGKSFTAPLNTAKPYKLSLWATSAVSIAGNATLTFSGPTINGFTYYEYNIAQGTSGVTVSGNATIDELRVYPKTARMRTVTYDPLIGKTSECDENNRIIYYEYDELGRLRFVKDENKNAIKMYEYNTTTKQNGCPGNYYNHAITEYFSKTGCAAGYMGSSVIFTVPANKYSSTISQLDADMKAENDINTNGQAYANAHGTCIKLYYNVAKSQNFTTENCAVGTVGGTVTYTVPANKYVSTISQADADQMAQTEMNANGQAYANSVAHRLCLYSTAPDWEGDSTASTRCQKDGNRNYTGHQEAVLTDINPHSSTYGQTQWKDVGVDETDCPHTVGSAPCLPLIPNSSGVYTGQPGTTISVTVTLNSSSSNALLTGNFGGVGIHLYGSGTTKQGPFNLTFPTNGYISWSLSLSGSGTYICTNINVQ